MNKKHLILAGFVILKFLLQYHLVSPEYDLQRDEFLHLDQAKHLAWGYFSVPPVTSWISVLISWLGNTVFWIRFFPALFGALTIVVVWKATEALKGGTYALVLGATCLLFSVLLRLNTLYQPNSLDVLCWTSFYFFVILYIKTSAARWVYWAAIVFAVGFLNKYNIIFLFAGLLPAVLLTEQRRMLSDKHIYFALLLALCMVSPNLWWQYQHSFPVLHHLKELATTQLVNVNRGAFLKGQVMFFLGSIFVLGAALYSLLRYPAFKPYRCLFWSMCFTLLIFAWLRAKDYYAIGLYPIYYSFGAVFLEDKFQMGWKRYLRPVAILVPLLFFIPMYHLVFPNKSPAYIKEHQSRYKKAGMLHWEDGKEHDMPQDFADMLGWKQLASLVDSVRLTLPAHEHTLILCDNYGQAGAINYYTRNEKLVANSFNADYINWFDMRRPIINVILVKEGDAGDPERRREMPLFEKVYLAGKRVNTYARESVIAVYVLQNAKINIWNRIIAERNRELEWQR